jgi:transmembrane sensor
MPIGDELVRDADEERLHSTWRGVRARMARRRRESRLRAGAIALAVAAGAALSVWAWSGSPPPGPLHHASGATLNVAESVAEPRVLRLEDRSMIELATGARLEPRRNDAERLELALVRGRVRFEVTPNGPRAWIIDAGLATVRVLGTAFVIDRGEARLVVEVERGRVRVESAELPDGRRELTGGERIELQRPTPSASAEGTEEAEPSIEGSIAGTQSEPLAPQGGPARAAPPPSPTSSESASMDSEPAEAIGAEPSELLRSADVARRAGRATEAREPLETILRDHPGHPEAPLAAITLARLQLGPLDDPTGALRSLRLARRLGVPRLFDAEVCSSMALVLDATGSHDEARREAERCLGRHGTPPHTERLRQLASP